MKRSILPWPIKMYGGAYTDAYGLREASHELITQGTWFRSIVPKWWCDVVILERGSSLQACVDSSTLIMISIAITLHDTIQNGVLYLL